MRQNSSPQTPRGMPGDRGPGRYDRSRELRFVRPAPVGATPVADHLVEPLRGRVTNLNQDLTICIRFYEAFRIACSLLSYPL
jgi:hypothetical protein